MADAQQEMYASEIGFDATPMSIIEACASAAEEVWTGVVRFELDDGRPVVAFYGTTDAGDEVLMEAYALAVAMGDRGYRLITVEIVNNAKDFGGFCGWSMHGRALEKLNVQPPSPPLNGDAARAVFQASQGSYVEFSKDQ